MKNYKNQIKLLALDLPIGVSRSAICPYCNASHEKSFCVTRSDVGILFYCFRSKCGARGFIGSLPGSFCSQPKEKKSGRQFTGKLSSLTVKEKDMLYKSYFIQNGYSFANWRRTNKGDLYIPLFGIYSEICGDYIKLAFRRPSGNESKCLHFWHDGVSKLHWPYGAHGKRAEPTIIVEDPISAIRVSEFGQGVALLGTHMAPRYVEELQKITDNVILVLDPDARAKAIAMKNKWGIYFKNFSLRFLSKDPKYLSSNQLEKELCL